MAGDIWRSTKHYVVPSSARDVMAVIGSIGVYSTGQKFAWRGMSNADFTVTSSLHRMLRPEGEPAVRMAEQELLAEARGWGLGMHSTGRVDDLQLLADLQHFAIPTRLIDVTSNPMTALWFACQASAGGWQWSRGSPRDQHDKLASLLNRSWQVGAVRVFSHRAHPKF